VTVDHRNRATDVGASPVLELDGSRRGALALRGHNRVADREDSQTVNPDLERD
jgi:hypothetical protein